jgi:thymidylate kinase
MSKRLNEINLGELIIQKLAVHESAGIWCQKDRNTESELEVCFIGPSGKALKACETAVRDLILSGWFLIGFEQIKCGCGVTLIRIGEFSKDEVVRVFFIESIDESKFCGFNEIRKPIRSAGMVLGVSGLDGSGKSTLVDRLVAAYLKADGRKPELIHLLPSWIPLPHQIFRRKKTSQNYTRPYSEPPVSSKFNGWVRLSYYLCAFLLARWTLLLASKQGKQIILDRSFVDFTSDLTRARIPETHLPNWLMRLASPCGKLFYLDASPDVVVARKGELTLDKAASLQLSYRATATTLGVIVLNGDNNPDMVFSELLSHITQEYMRRIESAELSK